MIIRVFTAEIGYDGILYFVYQGAQEELSEIGGEMAQYASVPGNTKCRHSILKL